MYKHASRTTCLDCGTLPINHQFLWMTSTADTFLSMLGAPKSLTRVWSVVTRISAGLAAPLWTPLSKVLKALRIISYNDDSAHACTQRSRVVWEEARRRGIPVRQIFLTGVPSEFYEVRIGGVTRLFDSLPIPPHYRTGALWADDKYILKKRFRELHIAVPDSYSVLTLEEAKKVLDLLGVVCVKPRSGSNGRHTFPHVSTIEELERAFRSVKKICRWVVVEQYLEGNLNRATCVDGNLVGFLESSYPTIVGDGSSTVLELVEKENSTKPPGVKDIELSPLHKQYIARRGYTEDSILEADKSLPLIYWAGYGAGGRNWEHGTAIHPEFQKEIERAARATELPLVGFDLIIPDPMKDPHTQVWGFIEANPRPWIDLHLAPLYGTPVNVAARVWDLWEKTS